MKLGSGQLIDCQPVRSPVSDRIGGESIALVVSGVRDQKASLMVIRSYVAGKSSAPTQFRDVVCPT